ncbi:class I SAM-dependent methyltransferase [Bacillus sp. SCS-151]|uniref:class I SAM-dependent methyltransferase n=1 Tax=Nanhaiella sioensis TaxID=3115293 RepID=UPI0039781558
MSTNIEQIFTVIDCTANLLQEDLACSYLEAVAETGENIFHETILQEELSELSKKRLNKEYEKLIVQKYSNEEIRKAYQLAALKGMRESTQPNHQMTPDSVGVFVSYLVSKFMRNYESFKVVDPAVGTGNLLTTVLNHTSDKQITSFGVDVDDLLIKLAYVNANLQQHPIQFFNQDSLEPLLIDPVDLVVCDLPIGYYPNYVVADGYELKSPEGHSYAHHLFIEQCMNYTKEGGYLFFLVPNNLFESELAPSLHKYLKETSIIQGLLQLPLSLFQHEKHAKSIFILQKKGAEVKVPKQALLVDLPSFSKKEAIQGIIQRIDSWIKVEK